MKNTSLALLFLLVAGQAAAQATISQTIELQPGWNAIYLEVQPTDNRVETVFAGLPVASVWRFIPDSPGMDFIADPSEGLAQLDGWYGYFPDSSGEGFLTNLFTLKANEPYLVRLDGTAAQSVVITGTPVLSRRSWTSNAYTLTGFEVDEIAPPTFAEYFAGSAAHIGSDIYRLEASGQWQLVSPNEAVVAGASYWVWTAGPSTYQGPLELSLDQSGALDFGGNLSQESLSFSSTLDVATDVVITRAISGDRMPLVFELTDPDTEEVGWPRLPDVARVPTPASGSSLFRIGVRRADFTATHMEEILELSNGFGVRKRLLVAADTAQAVIPPSAKSTEGGTKRGSKAAVDPYAGLWIGQAAVNRVSESQLAGTQPLAASGEFPIRIVIHVDASGQVRLLKEVTRMWEEGTLVPDPDNPGFNVVGQPGRFVLITRDELLSAYEGSALRDGVKVGVRYSTVSIDFEGTEMDMQGSLAPQSAISTTVLIPSDHPTNPFRHRYHPDHDNLDAQFLSPRTEAQAITREITIDFSSADASTNPGPDAMSSEMSGIFKETIIGLHRNPIFVSGPIELTRISAVSVLNQ